MTNRNNVRFYAINHEDGDQYYMLVNGPAGVSCFLMPDVKSDSEVYDGPRLTLSAYDAGQVMWVGRRVED